jgi:hypothetical protein
VIKLLSFLNKASTDEKVRATYLLCLNQGVNSIINMAKPHISTRLDEGFHDEIVQYAEDHDISKAEAMRTLLRNGLDHDSTEEIREGMDVIIEDGGHVLSDDIQQVGGRLAKVEGELSQVERELSQTQSRQSVLVILAVLLYAVAASNISTVIGLLGVVFVGLLLIYYAIVIDFAGIAQLATRGDE